MANSTGINLAVDAGAFGSKASITHGPGRSLKPTRLVSQRSLLYLSVKISRGLLLVNSIAI